VSYYTQALLGQDTKFNLRSRSCIAQQANTFLNDSRADVAALAVALLKNNPAQTSTMLTAICAGPNFGTEIDNGDGTINSDNVTDQEIMDQTQSMFPEVAALYYNSDGTNRT
jgi:hypothetical protein